MNSDKLYIKEWLKYRYLNISDLANKLGISIGTLSEQLNRGNFGLNRLYEIAQAINIPVAQLFINPEAMKESDCNNILCPYCHKPIKVTIEKAQTKSNNQK